MLSIIVPCYNCENTIESCVESILDALRFSKITEYEILLINDGSTDGTKRKLKFIINKILEFLQREIKE